MTWTNIPNALVAVGAKPFASTLQALRDNISALANGLSGAPRVQDAALSTVVTAAGQAWVSQRITTSGVNGGIAGSAAGAVGTYAFLRNLETRPAGQSLITYGFGSTQVGSLLEPSAVSAEIGGAVSGTWRCMGVTVIGPIADVPLNSSRRISLWLRIA